ncbi:MAG: hypothetical protein RBT86_04500 [Azospira sp.]|jgi:hypothetical protein|nr:hypothetical protein [Azospira sp.]
MKRLALLALFVPLLAACVNDGIGMVIDGPDHAISLLREQPRFWEKRMELKIVVSRLPDCQRRHNLQPAAIDPGFKVEIYTTGPDTYLLEQGKHLYLTETQTCRGFQKLTEVPPGGKGELLGVFREEKGKLVFVAAQPAQ